MLKHFTSSEANKNILKLITGTTMAQAIPIVMSPILTRLYTPDDFGVLALFISITTIFGTIANAKYELAIVLPKKEEDSINIVALCLLISTAVSLLLFILIIVFHKEIITILDNEEISIWLYFIPLVVFFIGLFNTLNYLNTRMKTFGIIAKVKVIKAVSMTTVQIGLGFTKAGVSGLIIGQIISHLFANGRLGKELYKKKNLFKEIKKKNIIYQAIRYRNFPLYNLGATLSNALSHNSTNIFIPLLYSTTVLGHYSLVQRVMGMPSILISNSIKQVFLQQANDELNLIGTAKSTYKATFKKLLFISLVIFGTLFFMIESLVELVFGEQWVQAGVYAKYLIPYMFMRFIGSPLTLVFIIYEKQKSDLIWQILLLLISLLTFLISWLLNVDMVQFLTIYSTLLVFYYVVILLVTFNIARKQK